MVSFETKINVFLAKLRSRARVGQAKIKKVEPKCCNNNFETSGGLFLLFLSGLVFLIGFYCTCYFIN